MAIKDRQSKRKSANAHIGNFVVEKRIGAGAQGDVFLATDVALQRKVALKIFRNNSKDDQFLSEARLTASFDHPNIVRVYQIGTEGKLHFIALEYVEGGALEGLIKRSGAISPRRAARYALGIARGLRRAHSIGMVHRDIKPRNLLVGRNGVLKIADFGLAFQHTRDVDQSRAIGTPKYMAPEQWLNQPCTQRSDLYSAGGCLYFMLVGKEPFPSASIDEVRQAHLHREIDIPASVPECLQTVIRECMDKNPATRTQSAHQLRLRLKQCLEELSLEKHREDSRQHVIGMPTTPLQPRRRFEDVQRHSVPITTDNAPETRTNVASNNMERLATDFSTSPSFRDDSLLQSFAEDANVFASALYSSHREQLAAFCSDNFNDLHLENLYLRLQVLQGLGFGDHQQLKRMVVIFSNGKIFVNTTRSLTMLVIGSPKMDFREASILMNVAMLKYERIVNLGKSKI